ncbi:carbohydrate ABC transporter permease [Paenibacillus sp. PAMC21692]|uniref:carbohydrate ABC transporter permease n=1 Tax=Paenibacillus sp. PAMC21692 TaxID=2762320 RepID=UPI00164D26A1|nr:carbohydrate ABC transporter permease [Paenibacillus sp. PAMC21692]QNK58199.1 carbohydrate ABC transporter permease [Paenibacillus sp. PAMC21692]
MISETAQDKLFLLGNRIFILLLVVVVLYPLVYIVSASISNPQLVNSGQVVLLPKEITFEGYQRVFQNRDIWVGYRNTVFYTVAGTFINLLLTLPCAYALSRKGVPAKNVAMALFVFTMFFNGGLIPTYLLVRDLNILNTVWAILLPNAVAVWNLIVSRTFFQMNFPSELEEASQIDGASHFVIFFKVALPLSMPLVAVMGLFYAVGHWNQYFNAMIYLSDRNLFPLQVFLREILVLQEMMTQMMMDGVDEKTLAEQARVADIIKYAVMVVSALPLLLVYPFVQRFFVKGILIGSLKG